MMSDDHGAWRPPRRDEHRRDEQDDAPAADAVPGTRPDAGPANPGAGPVAGPAQEPDVSAPLAGASPDVGTSAPSGTITTTREADGIGVADADQPDTKRAGQQRSFWKELPVLLVIALALALLIKAFLIQAFYIPSGSMEQTLRINDRVLVNKLVYDFRDIRRGEIIVFDANGSLAPDEDARIIAEPGNPISKVINKITTTLGFGVPPGEQDYIKRVIGISGDRVMCCDANERIVITPEGGTPVALEEPYVFENPTPQPFCAAGITEQACPPGATGVLVPEGRLFVMGDHRSKSSDSSAKYVKIVKGLVPNEGFNGTVDEDLVIGRAFVIVWPLSHLDWLSVPETFQDEVDAMVVATATPYGLGAVCVLPLAWLRRRRRRREVLART